eukprot:8370627-Pyramimonas_sp.AAC.1
MPNRPGLCRTDRTVARRGRQPLHRPSASTNSPLPDFVVIWEVSRVTAVLVDQVSAQAGLVL